MNKGLSKEYLKVQKGGITGITKNNNSTADHQHLMTPKKTHKKEKQHVV